MERRERNLGGAGEVQLVALDLVDVDLVGRQEAGAVHRFLTHQHRREDGNESLADEAVEREAVERELQQCHLADAVGETGTGDPSGPLEVDPAVLGRKVEVVPRLE